MWQIKCEVVPRNWTECSGVLLRSRGLMHMSTTRRRFTNQYKAKVALEALRGDKTIQEIAAKHQLHPNQG